MMSTRSIKSKWVFFIVFVITGVTLYTGSTLGKAHSYEEYLGEMEKPYRKFYERLENITDRPSPKEMEEIYTKFENDIQALKIPVNAEESVRESYQQLLSMPEIYRKDYQTSNYKYSTIAGQAKHAKMMLDYIAEKK
ncbi:hypothetical protein [Bacillus sp. B-jedd]|uniref:hypothetical protein n=1 Tax=Bacillus sp. B-jedd TaxID=1476857 RepID=UPI000515556C|nr:hypothetical protein [Bacillus sp. B-jedd]CEG26501.1 hypothetical protein BN1002_01348 [Bacillus sp. B-jedd]